jgi:NAD(P)-dependent dehydrogenase (short-subunit alcohol dehydrogenase family)
VNQAKGESKQRADSNITFLPGDVTRPETWKMALALAQTNYGRVDVVVNNAGENIQSITSVDVMF